MFSISQLFKSNSSNYVFFLCVVKFHKHLILIFVIYITIYLKYSSIRIYYLKCPRLFLVLLNNLESERSLVSHVFECKRFYRDGCCKAPSLRMQPLQPPNLRRPAHGWQFFSYYYFPGPCLIFNVLFTFTYLSLIYYYLFLIYHVIFPTYNKYSF